MIGLGVDQEKHELLASEYCGNLPVAPIQPLQGALIPAKWRNSQALMWRQNCEVHKFLLALQGAEPWCCSAVLITLI